jgi:hypothetical protein
MTITPTFSPFVYNRAVRDSQLPAIARHVAMTLATYAGKAGEAFPAQETLEGGTGWARRTVNDALNTLEVQGWLTRVKRGHKGRATLYRLHVPDAAPARGPGSAPVCGSPPPDVQDATTRVVVTCTPTPQGEQTQNVPWGGSLARPAGVPGELWDAAEPILRLLLGSLSENDAERFAAAWPLAKARDFCWRLTDLTGCNVLASPRKNAYPPDELVTELTAVTLDDVLHVGPALYARLLRVAAGLPAVPPPEDPRTRVREPWVIPPGPIGDLIAEAADKLSMRTRPPAS